MATPDAMAWFKHQFGNKITAAIAGTPFTLDLLTAIATQESYGDAWRLTYKTRPVDDVLKLCVGDTLDRAHTFPKDKDDLIQHSPQGQQVFDIAREALTQLAQVNPRYAGAAHNPNKFCHGFGIFQYDIQFFKGVDPNFFLQKKWYDFDECLARCVNELAKVANHIYPGKKVLTDEELTYVAIGYNTGPAGVIVGGGFKQGHEDDGVYYGENIDKYLKLAHTVH